MDRVFLVIRDREHVLRGPAAQERRKEKRALVIRMTKNLGHHAIIASQHKRSRETLLRKKPGW